MAELVYVVHRYLSPDVTFGGDILYVGTNEEFSKGMLLSQEGHRIDVWDGRKMIAALIAEPASWEIKSTPIRKTPKEEKR